MSYDPSHRTPPRQERWPQATPAEGWPPYREGEGEPAGRSGARGQQPVGSHRRQAGSRSQADPRSAVATAALPVAGDTYGTADARDTGAYDTGAYDTGGYRVGDFTAGSRGQESYGYPGTGNGYADATDGFDGAPGSSGRTSDSFNGTADGYDWARVGYAGSPGGDATGQNGYAGDPNGYAADSYTQAQQGYVEPWNRPAAAQAGHGQ